MSDAVTNCKFESTDQASDDIVLFKILQARLATLQFCSPSVSPHRQLHAGPNLEVRSRLGRCLLFSLQRFRFTAIDALIAQG